MQNNVKYPHIFTDMKLDTGMNPHSFTGVKLNMGMTRKAKFHVYIVKCARGTYYAGYTNNLEKRIALHNKGNGAKYLKGRSPVKLVYVREYIYYKNALRAERNMKKRTRKEKEILIKRYERANNN
jgi:putative endonuclease